MGCSNSPAAARLEGADFPALDDPDLSLTTEVKLAIRDRRNRPRQPSPGAFGNLPRSPRQIGSHRPVDRRVGEADHLAEDPNWHALRPAKLRVVPEPAQRAHDLRIG